MCTISVYHIDSSYRMSTHTYPYKLTSKIKVAICNDQGDSLFTGCLMFDLVICRHISNKSQTHITCIYIPILSSQVVSLEVANFCAAMDTLIDQDDTFLITVFFSGDAIQGINEVSFCCSKIRLCSGEKNECQFPRKN